MYLIVHYKWTALPPGIITLYFSTCFVYYYPCIEFAYICSLPTRKNVCFPLHWIRNGNITDSLMRVSYLINSTLNRTQKRSERKRPQPCAECYETLALNDQMLSVEYCSHFTKNAIEIDYFTRIVNYYQFYGLKFCLLICLFVNLIYDLDQDDACIVNICYFNYRIVVITLF